MKEGEIVIIFIKSGKKWGKVVDFTIYFTDVCY